MRTCQVGCVQNGGGLAAATAVGGLAFSSAMVTVEWGGRKGSDERAPLLLRVEAPAQLIPSPLSIVWVGGVEDANGLVRKRA